MGRWKRKKGQYLSRKSSNDSASSSATTLSISDLAEESNSKFFTRKDRKLVIQYLEEYKNGALQVYRGNYEHRMKASSEPLVIAGRTFPFLTEEVLCQPYLKLQRELSSKQRRCIHELCVDVGIFHCGVGTTHEGRCIVVSIYSDGLSYVPEFGAPPSLMPIRNYRPWAYRQNPVDFTIELTNDLNGEIPIKQNKSNVRRDQSSTRKDSIQITKRVRNVIQALIDQPGECLRDDIDSLDFLDLELRDLSKATPPGFEEEEWMLVDTPQKMRQCVQELEDANPTELAFDLEAYNKSNYAQMTCLLQITTNKGREYVIDPLAPGVWDLVGELAPLFADPKVVKIGHSIGGLDVRCLHRDFGIFVVNAFDTYEAAKCLKLPGVGLAKVCATYGLPDCKMYQSLKDQYQNCDWRQRPLTGPMIQYGRYDIRYLIELRTLMIRDLAKQELWDNDHVSKEAEARQVATSLAAILRKFDEEDEACDSDVDSKNSDDEGYSTPVSTFDEEFQDSYELESEAVNGILERKAQFNAMELRMNSALMQVISLSQNRCLDLWTSRPEPHLKNSEFLLILKRSKSGEIECTSSQIQLYDKLVRWREYVATQEECLPGFICPLDLFAHISYKRPTTEAALRKLSYILPDLLEERDNIYVYELLQLVIESRKVDELEAEEVSDIPCYEAYLEQEKKRERSLSTAASSNLWRSTVTYSAICVAAIAITILAVRRRR